MGIGRFRRTCAGDLAAGEEELEPAVPVERADASGQCHHERKGLPCSSLCRPHGRTDKKSVTFSKPNPGFFFSSHNTRFVEDAVTSLANWLHLEDKDFLSGISQQLPS